MEAAGRSRRASCHPRHGLGVVRHLRTGPTRHGVISVTVTKPIRNTNSTFWYTGQSEFPSRSTE